LSVTVRLAALPSILKPWEIMSHFWGVFDCMTYFNEVPDLLLIYMELQNSRL